MIYIYIYIYKEKKLIIDDPALPYHYEEEKASVEFVSIVEERYHKVFDQATDMFVNCIWS